MKVKVAELHSPLRMAGKTEATLNQEKIRGIKMFYHKDGLMVSIGNTRGIIPLANVKFVELEDDQSFDMKEQKDGRQAVSSSARAQA